LWSVSDRIDTALVSLALQKAYAKQQPNPGLLIHSDRGVQYSSDAYRALVSKYGMVQSMSRKGNCWDNSMAESFFRSLKVEAIYGSKIASKTDAENIIFRYIEQFYNNKRIHSFLLYRSPAQWEADILFNPEILNLRNHKLLHF
jgi:putative transposase